MQNNSKIRSLLSASALPLLCLLVFLTYLPGLGGELIFDDTINIEQNRAVHVDSLDMDSLRGVWNSGISASFGGRSVAMLSFALNYYYTGLDPWWFKLTNLVLHLLTTVAIYNLCRSLLRFKQNDPLHHAISDHTLALLITAAWALHPLLASTVLYVVQRMAILAALFTVLALLSYCRFRQLESFGPRQLLRFLLTFFFFTALAVLSKETGLLIPAFAALIEFTILRDSPRTVQQEKFIKYFFALVLAVPAVLVVLLTLVNASYILAGYEFRDFTLVERFLTQMRVLWDYISWVLVPDIRNYVFYHDDYPVSTSLISPLSTLAGLLGMLCLGLGVIFLRGSFRWLAFGLGFFIVGHALESTILPLELVFEHRNYLPAFGLLFGLFVTLFRSPLIAASFRPLLLGFAGLFLALQLQGVYAEARKWSSTPEFLFSIREHSPDSPRIHNEVGRMYLKLALNLDNPIYFDEAKSAFVRSTELDDKQINTYGSLILAYNYAGESVPEEYRRAYVELIQEQHITNSAFMNMVSMTRCYMSGTCTESPEVLAAMFNALTDNRQLSALQKQGILNEIATDTLNAYQRVADALSIYYLAENLSNTLTITDIRIIVLELERGNIEAARNQLEDAEGKTVENRRLADRLRELRKRIETASIGVPGLN